MVEAFVSYSTIFGSANWRIMGMKPVQMRLHESSPKPAAPSLTGMTPCAGRMLTVWKVGLKRKGSISGVHHSMKNTESGCSAVFIVSNILSHFSTLYVITSACSGADWWTNKQHKPEYPTDCLFHIFLTLPLGYSENLQHVDNCLKSCT